jgi:hypothetical protein
MTDGTPLNPHWPEDSDPETWSEAALDQWVEDYLEGHLPPAEAARFERSLTHPKVAAAFREILALRELLRALPPDAPPAELVAKLEETLRVAQAAGVIRPERYPRLRAALQGLGWTVRGPALALATGGALRPSEDRSPGTREALAGLATIGYSLGPITATRTGAAPRKRPAWWRRLLRRRRR